MRKKLKMGFMVALLTIGLFTSSVFVEAGEIGVAGDIIKTTVIDKVENKDTIKDLYDGGDEYYIGNKKVEFSASGYYNAAYIPCAKNGAAWQVTSSKVQNVLVSQEREKIGQTDTLVSIRYVMTNGGIILGDDEENPNKQDSVVVQEYHYERVELFKVTKHWKKKHILNVVEASASSVAVQEKNIINMNSDNDVSNSNFNILSAKGAKSTKNSITINWNRVPNASGYIIYGNQCGKKNRYQKIADLKSGNSTSWTHKKLLAGKSYKYLIVAYKMQNGSRQVLSKSKTLHIFTKKGKIGNFKSVKVNKKSLTLKVGKTFKLKASGVRPGGVKSFKPHRAMAYESNLPAVATVSSKGVIKGVKAGTCYIYVYACNGVYKKVKVTVK